MLIIACGQQAADYDEDTVMEYTPPEETNRRQRQREMEAEREREQKVRPCSAVLRCHAPGLAPDHKVHTC